MHAITIKAGDCLINSMVHAFRFIFFRRLQFESHGTLHLLSL